MRAAIQRINHMYNYAQAEGWFNRLRKPRSKYWQDENERPLSDIQARDLRLVRAKAVCPDTDKIVQVYHARWGDNVDSIRAWVTFYPRLENGEQRVTFGARFLCNNTDSFLACFMEHASSRSIAVDGTGATRMVSIPIVTQRHCELLKQSASFTLLMNKDGFIIPERSWHPPLFRRFSTEIDNDKRARLRAQWYPLCYMAAIGAEAKISETIKRAVTMSYSSTAFSTALLPAESLLKSMEQELDSDGVRNYEVLLNAACMYAVNKFFGETWETHYINSEKNQKQTRPLLESDRRGYRSSDLRREAIALYSENYGHSPYIAYENLGFTAEQVATALARMIVGKYHRKDKSGREAIPMFPDPVLMRGDIHTE